VVLFGRQDTGLRNNARLGVSDRKTAGDFKGETNCARCISKLVGGFVVA
jgi:hypothetical protein